MARFAGVDEAFSALDAALTEELAEGMVRVAEAVAVEARANHDYQNRSGALQERTMVGGVPTTTANHVTIKVVGDTRYGKYIEEGTKNKDESERIRPRRFLENAATRLFDGGRAAAEIGIAMDRAASRAGWK